MPRTPFRSSRKPVTGRANAPTPDNAPKNAPADTTGLHPRNRHTGRYDFDALCEATPALKGFLRLTPKGNRSIDFTDSAAIKTLNQALLKHWYQRNWDLPEGYLCPPIPGRADYIHNLADLLAEANQGKRPQGKRIRVLDIGCGANCIYPLIGYSEYQWHFIAVDIHAGSLASAQTILDMNKPLKKYIELRQQPNAEKCFGHILKPGEFIDITLSNPPFHESLEQMQRGNQRKWKNLETSKKASKDTPKAQPPRDARASLNFGGQSNELWCPGGEVAFVSRMMRESQQYRDQVCWFTSLVSRQAALPALKKVLKEVGATQHKVVSMAQGQKSSRFIAWTFLTPEQQRVWRQLRWQ